jgi:drug/metabolite transporter (DMT)-like permease
MMTTMLIAIIVLSNAAGDVLITRAMKQVGEISNMNPGELLRIAGKVFRNGNFLAGVLSLAAGFGAFLTVLSRADLSFVFPVMSLVFVVSTLGARFILRETVTMKRWAGILIVCLGVALVSLS